MIFLESWTISPFNREIDPFNLLNTTVFNWKTYVYRRKNEQIYMYLISFWTYIQLIWT